MWSNKYIGIPFKDGGRDSNGLDCWGLVRLVYKNEYNIALPSFSSSYTTVDDTARLQELVDQYKEGWTQIAEPYEGSVVLLKTMGSATHVGVLVNNHQFLHVNEGTDVTVENLASHRWNKRVIGYYKYSTERAAILNAAPHPLRTQLYTLPVTPGTTLKEISDWLFEKWQLSKKIAQKIIIIVNGQVVEQSKWSGFVVQEHDRIEYRALAGKGNGATIFRLVAMIAISFAAPYLAGALQASMSGNLFMTALAQQFAAGSAFLVSGWTGAALTAGITLAGSLLVNAIAPIRPPGQNTNDPGNAEAQLIATGTGNRLTPYESIPIVLGKMSITPPLGAVNYVTYQDERDTYLSLMLTWGYGPLVLVNSTPTLQASSGGAGLRIGELAASDYTIDAIEHLNMYHPSSGTLVALGGDQTKFDTIYGTDVAQHFRNLELVNNTHPFAGSVASPSPIEAAVAALPGGTPASERYTTIEIAVHFPQGLRKVKAQGENAGKSFALTDSANGGNYPVKVKYEWDIGSGWTAITSLTTAGEASGVVVYGTENKKDAFTKTHTVDLPTPTTVGVKVRATRLTGGWADPPQEGTSEYNNFTANSGSCYVYSVQTASRSDDNYTYTDSYDVEAIDNSITTRAACDAVLGRWVADSNALIKQAEDWRFAHQVNLLSLTVRRNAKPTKNPPNSTITKTAIRLKSSQEINGQLEGINAVVQTYGRDWKGGNSLTIDKSSWTFDAIDNPASLLLHVLISSANPRQIAWNDVETRVDLSKLQYWHYYCQQKGFKYNAIVAQQRSMLDVMRDICAAGRASPSLVDGKWTVVIDEPKANIVQHFSPHNSWGFEGTRVLNKLPEGLRVNYYDESDNYQNSEIILYKTGYNEDGSGGKTAAKLFETIQLPGVTNATLVEDHARWHMAQAKLRREVYTLNTDLEYVICNRGDRVTVTHDVPLWGSGSGRIKTRLDAKTYVLDEAVLINPAKQYQIKVRSNSYPLENTVATIVSSFTIASSVRASNIVTATVVDSYHPFSVGDILNITGSIDPAFNNATATVIEVTANTFKYEDAGSNGSNVGGTATLTQGLYQKIAVSANIGVKAGTSVNLADSGDLFLFGETSRISNDLLVLGIDPTNSKSAKLTLVDYGVYTDPVTPANSYNIFNDYLTLSESTIFATNITLPESLTSLQLTDVPTITSLSSGVGDAEVVSPGVYRYRIRVSYSNNATSLSQYIQQVECQYDLVGVNDLERSIIVKYDANTVYIPDVDVGKTYKVKLRYITRDGITGPWSSESTHTVLGKTSNLDSVGYITAIQKGKFIELNPVINPMPVDFKHFEIRVWKTTKQNSDFWSYTSTVANGLITSSGVSAQPTVFKIVKSTGICTVDLTEFAQPRISEAGVVYNVACRAVDNAGNYSKYSALTFVTIRNIIPPPFKLIPQAGAINLHVEPPIVNSKLRDDVAGLKVWVYSTSKAANSLVSGDLKYDSPSLKANISDLDVEKTLYYRFAVTSLVDPSVYTISNQYSYIPRSFVEDRTDDLPPNPLGISVSAAISTIIVTLPSSTVSGVSQSTDYNYSDYAAGTLRTNASSTHKSTVVYGIKANSLLQAVAFSAVQDSVLGEFEDKKIFTLPAEAGTIYALFFKYRNKAGRLSAGAEGPFMCETGLDMQKFLDMMANQITEGQLYKGLQSRISSVDRGEKRVAVEVSQLSDQYTVKIDNAGHVAGFGLSNTSTLANGSALSDGSPFSEFGVVADRFWVAAPAVVGSTAPTVKWHGRVWVDTSGVGLNEGLIGGVTVVYNTYSPSIHNPITYASDSTYHYWELKTKTQLDKLQVDIGGYTNRGAWSATTTYALKDYVYDLDSNVYYVCIKAYTPSTITNLATKNADKVGNFTATGTFAVDKTLYITGTETILTQANGGGKDSALKLGASYKSSGTFYYITSVSGSVFVLSLTRNGKPISTGIKSTTKYWSETKNTLGAVTGGEWISVPKSDMFPFVVNSTARTLLDTTGNPSVTIPPGVYINNAFIEDASITNAKIANAAIDSAKISELTASKIKGGTIDADLINAGALTVGKLDLQSLRNNINITWALAMPRLSTTAVERTVTLAKGIYEIIIYSSFYKEDTFSTSDGAVTEQATIVAEVSGIGGATCTGYGQWAKEVDSTKFEGKLTSKAGTVNSGSITISNVSGSGYIGEGGGSWSFSVTPTASGGTTTLTNDKVDGVAGKSQTVRLNTALTQVNRAQFNVTTAGDYTFRLNSPTLPSGTWLHAGTLSLLNYLSSAGAATHTLTIASSVNEGATLTGTLATTNIDAGTGYQWKIIHTGTVSNNSHYEEIAGGITIGSNGSGTFSIKPINDKTTNPAGQAKTFTVEISKAGVGVVATSGTITVNDTSLGPTYSLAFSPGTINETDNSTTTGTVTATANAPTDGTLLYWVIKPSAGYVDNPAKYFSPTSGTITINSGSGTFTIKALEDNETTASKSFQIEVTNDIGSTITFASNPTVTVTDSSQTPGTGGSVSLSGIGNYFVTSPSASVSAGATVYFYPDGTWQAKESTGTTSSGNWFTPTTPGIGSKYWINVTSTSVTNSGGGGSHSSNLGWTQLGAMQNFYAEATGYRCVDPMTPILVDVEGTTVLAKDLQVGMQVYTMHEYTKYWDMFNIVAIQQTTKPKALVTFSDNTTLLVSTSHKFYIGNRQWKQLFDLVPGDFVASRRNGMKQITSIEDQGTGEVISIEVEDAHTYVANDMISHNIKLREASMYSAEYERAFTVQIADNASGTSATSQVVNIGGQVGTPL